MFESSSSSSAQQPSTAGGSTGVNYFELGTTSQTQHTSVIVPPRHNGGGHVDHLPLTPSTPYYPTNGYGFPLFLGTEFLQFPPSDVTSPLTPNISSPLTPAPFCGFPTIPGTPQLYNRSSFNDFYAATSSSPMVQYNTKKSASGRKPKEEDIMDDDDDDKKLKRRQRNKEAAARCRQRRLDLMKELQDQVNAFKSLNDKKTAECSEMRNKLASLKSYLESHECKLSPEERMTHLRQLIIPPSTVNHHQPLRIHTQYIPSRAGSTAPSVMSNHSSSSSEQHSPIEDYKPSIDQLTAHLPPISFINKDRLINPMPPPPLPASTSSGIPVITSIPIHTSSGSIHLGRLVADTVFAEPEPKIPKIDPMDRTLASLVSTEDVERPSMLPMLSRNPVNQPITTPSRIFRNGEYYQTPQSGSGLFVGGDVNGDFLSTNTGLTPSGQPAMNFVSTPTPIQQSSDHDLRPL
uniref:BZIP domain-containing protein n=1 Tax=Caenorhabditis japonica TaxID=281687 RepID=A0A8R1E158_CAEJA